MLRPFLIILLTLLHRDHSDAQNWRHAGQYGEPSGFTTITAVSKYLEDLVLSVGNYNTPRFSSGGYSADNVGRDDVFVLMTNQDGQTVWAGGFGGPWEDVPSNVAADQEGNFYVAGQFRSLSMQVGTETLENMGDADGFLVKYRSDKSIAWAKRIATAYTDKITGLATDSKGRIWVAGQTTNAAAPPIKRSVFVMLLDTDGNILWIRVGAPVTGDLLAAGLVTDESNNGYFSGNIAGTAVFGNNDTLQGCSELFGGFILIYDESGKLLNSVCDSHFHELKGLHWANGKLYATGVRLIMIKEDNGGFRNDLKTHTARYDTQLRPVWGRTASTLSKRKGLETPVAVAADDLGNVYVNGIFYNDSMDFAGEVMVNPKYEGWNYPDIFLLKYNADGEEIRGKSYGGDIMDMASGMLVWGNDHLLMAGAYQSDSLVFGDAVIVHEAEKRSFSAHGNTLYLRNYYSWLAYARPFITCSSEAKNNSLLLYPNPTNNTLHLQSEAFMGQLVVIQIFSADGRLVMETVPCVSSINTITLDVTDLPKGIYLLQYSNSTTQGAQRFVKY